MGDAVALGNIFGAPIEEVRFAVDSPLEGAGFEPSVPVRKLAPDVGTPTIIDGMRRRCDAAPKVRFASDSPLEERVSSEPVSEVGFSGLAIRHDSERFMDDNRSGKRLFRARKRRNFSLCPLAASPAISILNC